jgi:hypothetical protein
MLDQLRNSTQGLAQTFHRRGRLRQSWYELALRIQAEARGL